jgi:hypothetical protein
MTRPALHLDGIIYTHNDDGGVGCHAHTLRLNFPRAFVCFGGSAFTVSDHHETPEDEDYSDWDESDSDFSEDRECEAPRGLVCVPRSVTILSNGAFYSHPFHSPTSQVAFEFGSRVSELGNSCFYFCTWLESICIPSSVLALRGECFLSCLGLLAVRFAPGSQLSRIEYEAFSECRKLRELTLPKSVDAIPSECFFDCYSLKALGFEPGFQPSSIGIQAFSSCIIETIVIPRSVEIIGRDGFRGCACLAVVAFESGSRLSVVSECAFANCRSLKAICIPRSVTRLGHDCFLGCTKLTLVEFENPSQIGRLEAGTFEGCVSLISVCLPGSILGIEEECFYDCHRLRNVRIDGGAGRFLRIDEWGFTASSLLESITVAGFTQLASMDIPFQIIESEFDLTHSGQQFGCDFSWMSDAMLTDDDFGCGYAKALEDVLFRDKPFQIWRPRRQYGHKKNGTRAAKFCKYAV